MDRKRKMFYDACVTPSLEELQEEFRKIGVDTYINKWGRLFNVTGESILVYHCGSAVFCVEKSYQRFFKNDFNGLNYPKRGEKLIFKSIKELEVK